MYLRTTARKNKDGTTVQYFQLAHNTRHPETGRSVPTIIHNFGRADEIDHDALKRLCISIARVCDLAVVDKSDEASPDRSGAGSGRVNSEWM